MWKGNREFQYHTGHWAGLPGLASMFSSYVDRLHPQHSEDARQAASLKPEGQFLLTDRAVIFRPIPRWLLSHRPATGAPK